MSATLERKDTGEQALARLGFDGERLMRLARKVGSDYLRATGATLDRHRFEDLTSFLVVQGLRAAITWDPSVKFRTYGSNGGSPAASYLADVMERRCVDYFRSKAEGFGDKRYGNHDRVVLSPMEDDADPDVDFELSLSESRVARWQRHAQSRGWSLADMVCFVMDDACDQFEHAA